MIRSQRKPGHRGHRRTLASGREMRRALPVATTPPDPSRPYVLISSGPDGRPRTERFESIAAYRARLSTLEGTVRGVSLDDLVELIDA